MSRLKFVPAALLSLSLMSPLAAHAVSGPFAELAGTWSGGGTLTTGEGNAERLRCRATYDVDQAGSDLRLSIRCASQSYNFELAGNINYRDGRISGNWSESSQNAGGSISGRASAGHIEARASGQTFTANLAMTTKGNRQTISITSPGATISNVSLTLSRN